MPSNIPAAVNAFLKALVREGGMPLKMRAESKKSEE